MRSLIGLGLILLAAPAAAQMAPLPPPPAWPGNMPAPMPEYSGSRIQSVEYVADKVVQVRGAPGFQVTVELAQDEHVENVAVGDSGAWQVAVNHRGDRLFIKPLQGEVMTNMTVITDTRLYAFELVPAGSDASDLPYLVRFRYPSADASARLATGPATTPSQMGRYKLSGDRALQPVGMHDDGVHTYIEWPEDRPLSAIYAINELGQEALVDSKIRSGQIVIDSVHKRIVFRRDGARATATRLSGDR